MKRKLGTLVLFILLILTVVALTQVDGFATTSALTKENQHAAK